MSDKLVPWILLFTAILLEVAGITSMKLSRGFTEPLPSLAVPIFYVCSAAAVILALKRLDLSVTYAIWSGVGTALAAFIGIAYFREPLTLFKLASLTLVILGVVGLSLAARQTNSQSDPTHLRCRAKWRFCSGLSHTNLPPIGQQT